MVSYSHVHLEQTRRWVSLSSVKSIDGHIKHWHIISTRHALPYNLKSIFSFLPVSWKLGLLVVDLKSFTEGSALVGSISIAVTNDFISFVLLTSPANSIVTWFSSRFIWKHHMSIIQRITIISACITRLAWLANKRLYNCSRPYKCIMYLS